MSSIETRDVLLISGLSELKGSAGQVDNCNDRTFAQELHVDIEVTAQARNGASKGRRLRCVLHISTTRRPCRPWACSVTAAARHRGAGSSGAAPIGIPRSY